jgi:hypothetical protein
MLTASARMTPNGRWGDGQVTSTVVPQAAYYAHPFRNLILPLDAQTASLDA